LYTFEHDSSGRGKSSNPAYLSSNSTKKYQNSLHFFNCIKAKIVKDAQELVFWTSGSDEGENCDVNRKYSWCSTGSVFPETDLAQRNNWLDGPGLVSGSGRCLAMAVNASSAALTHADCSERKPFLCQVPSIMSSYFFPECYE